MRKLLIIVVVLFASLATVHAQTPDWGTWETILYDASVGRLVILNSNGGTNELDVPTPPNILANPPSHIAVSPDGNKLVYLLHRQGVEGVNGGANAVLIVYDRTTNLIDQYPVAGFMAHSLDYHASPHIFSNDSRQIAMGYYQNNSWSIVILDLEARNYVGTLLSPQNIGMQGISGAFQSYFQPTPIITNFSNDSIEFYFVPGNAGGPSPEVESYRWNYLINTVSQTQRFNSPVFDYFPMTDEVIQGMQLAAYPSPVFNSPLYVQNTLTVTDADDVRRAVFNSANTSLHQPVFVQNGNQVMYQGLDAASQATWSVINRQGQVSGIVSAPFAGNDLGITDVIGTEFGALLVTDTALASNRLQLPLMGLQTVLYLDLRENASGILELVYNSSPVDGGNLQFLWIQNTQTAMQSGYGAWVELAPSGMGMAQATPTLSPPIQADPIALRVGGQAQIFTTEGDALNMRSAPGTQFERVSQLPSGSMVTLLEGPVDADGFTWWRVRTVDGIEGWTVESADNVQTLQPR